MRFILTVTTIGKEITDVRTQAIADLDKALKKLTRHCKICGKPYLSERRRKKKYCGDACRTVNSNKTKMIKYYKGRGALQKKNEARRALRKEKATEERV